MNAISLYRVGRWCHERGVPLVPQVIHRLIFLLTGAVVPMTAEIGEGTQLAYGGNGVVLHHNARIGRNVMIAPQVTLGGRCGHAGVPVIEDDCYIGVGAKVLGPVRIGAGAQIGANAVVIDDVPPRSVAAGIPASIIRHGVASWCECEAARVAAGGE
jgi:serine O-acetyltransferase